MNALRLPPTSDQPGSCAGDGESSAVAGGRARRPGGPRPREHLGRGVLALLLAPLAVGTSGHSVAGLLPLLAAETGTRAAWVGQLAAVFGLVCALAAPLLAVVTGRWERRRLLLVCLLVTAAGNAVAAIAPSFLWLVIGRVVTALGAAMTTAVAVGLAASAAPPARRARAMAVVLAGLTVALSVGVPGVALAAYHWGFRPAMWCVVALCVLAAAAIAAAGPTLPAPPALALRDRLAGAARPGVGGVLGGGLLAWTSTGLVYPYLTLVIGGPDGPGGPDSLYLTAYGLGAGVGTLLGGQLVDVVGARLPLVVATATGAAALLLLAFAAVTAPAALALVTAWGAASWATTPALNAWLDRLAPPGRSALLLALAGSVIYLGMGVGAVLGGLVVATIGVEHLAAVATIGAALACALFLGCGRTARSCWSPQRPALSVEVSSSWR